MDTLLHRLLAWFLHSLRSIFGLPHGNCGGIPWGGRMGLYVEGVLCTVPHAVPDLLLFALRCFALHALCFALCVGFAFPRCAAGGDSLDDTGDKSKHGAIPECWMIESAFIIGGL